MNSERIKLLSTDFDGTLVSRVSEPVLDRGCVELIRELQEAGAVWAINTGRSVDLLESGLTDFEFPIHPDFILTTEREVFRPGRLGHRRHLVPATVSRRIRNASSTALPKSLCPTMAIRIRTPYSPTKTYDISYIMRPNLGV